MADDVAEPLIEKGEPTPWQRESKRPSWLKRNLIFVLPQAVTLSLIPVAYFLGINQGTKYLPQLPTHPISESGFSLHLQRLDDEFEVRDPANLKFKGPPRPELDDAWNGLIEHMNIRVSAEEARRSNFASVTLNDGSGDVSGMPAVFHSLHCLKTLQRIQFPDAYPEDFERYKPPFKGGINDHVDHCIDNLRQALMCQGDMALYRYEWIDGRDKPMPFAPSNHICINWEHMMDWASERSFSLGDGLLQNPNSDKLVNMTAESRLKCHINRRIVIVSSELARRSSIAKA